jgi:hypothetical protein
MRLDATQHPFPCGSDLHAQAMNVCILDQQGAIMLRRNMTTNSETLLYVIVPYRDGLVVAIAWLFTWSWLANLCADECLPTSRDVGYCVTIRLASHPLKSSWSRGSSCASD